MGYVAAEEVIDIKHYRRMLPLEKISRVSVWKRRITMYRGTAPSFLLCLVLLYTLHSTASMLMTTDKSSRVHQTQALGEKHAYLQHMKELFDSLADRYNTSIDSNTFVRRLTVMGVVAELLSARDSPVRTLMPYMRGNQVLQDDADGSFKVIVTIDPPSKGEQCFLVEGNVDYVDLSGIVTRIQPVSCSKRPEVWSNLRLSEWSAGDAKVNQYSNGSKGDFLLEKA